MMTFLKVADSHSLTKAARALSVSRSVVSDRINQLEELVGQKLLLRTTRRVDLTQVGNDVYPIYSDLVSRMGDLENNHREISKGLSGRLRISSVIDAGIAEIADLTSEFMKEHPELSIELVIANSIFNPVEDAFDLSLHYRKFSHPLVMEEQIASVECGVFASHDYLKANGCPNTPHDLKDHDCVGYSFQSTVNEWNTNEWLFHTPMSKVSVRIPLYARSNSGHILSKFIANGHGVGVIPKSRANSLEKQGQLVEILSDYRIEPIKMFASYSKATAHTEKIQKFISFLKQEIDIVLFPVKGHETI